MSADWRWGWEASSTGDDLPGDPPKRSRPIDVTAEVARLLAAQEIRDRLAPQPRYRQTTEDEAWLNKLGITGKE